MGSSDDNLTGKERDGDAVPGGQEGADELRILRGIRLAKLAARRAGPTQETMEPLPDEQLDAPLDVPELCAPNEHLSGDRELPSTNGYILETEITAGGQATVYRAVQESTGRPVALKVIAGGAYAGARARARLDREAQILATLDHPNVVPIIDRGRTADGSFFFVMPFIEGCDLDEYAKSHDREPGAVVPLLLKATEAVAEAHRRGVLHRDLKPSNIRVDRHCEPHVLDFGLARLLDETEAAAHARDITRTGQIVGSLPWLSPEQASGVATRVDFRSDVYALGLTLYHALTGEFPYKVDGGVRQVLDNIATAAPPAPSKRSPGANMDDALDRIVLKALAKKPSDRYASAGDLAADLAAYLTGKPTTVARVDSPNSRQRAALFTSLVLCGVAICGTIIVRERAGKKFGDSLPAAQASVHTGTAAAAPVDGPGAQAKPVRAKPRQTTRPAAAFSDGIGLSFLTIPPGRFLMGSPTSEPKRTDEEELHEVEISRPLWMSTSEVTQRQYELVMEREQWDPQFDDPDLPADEITWYEAVEFCRRMSGREGCVYRLPTEAEWEYACRAGADGPYAGTGELDSMGWHNGNSGGKLRPVSTLACNDWGLYDMHGNVREWCQDTYARYPKTEGVVVNPRSEGASFLRIARGGGFDDTWDFCRSAARIPRDPKAPTRGMGFRVVREKGSP